MKDLNQEYDERVTPLRDLAPHLESLMRTLMTTERISLHYVTSRVKTKVSTLRKLQRPDKDYTGIGDLTDVLGIRIVTYFPDDVDAVAEVVRREFLIDPQNSIDKRAALDPDRFGYLSLHFVAKLNESRASLAEYRQYGDVAFEIQVRSILQHAWAEIEHDLGYKSAAAIPAEIRRRFSRLAGLLELADAEFAEIKKFLTNKDAEIEQASSNPETVDLDAESLFIFIQRDPSLKSFDRQAGRIAGVPVEPATRSYASLQLENVERMGIHTWQELSDRLEEDREILHEFAKAWILDLYQDSDQVEFEHINSVPQGIGIYYLYLWEIAQGNIPPSPGIEEYLDDLKRARDYVIRSASQPGGTHGE